MLRPLAAALAAVLFAAPLAAQVGYAPNRSPYRDLVNSTSLTATFGRFTNDGGSYGVGPVDGFTYGLRYAFRANKFLELSLGATRLDLQRSLVDPSVILEDRVQGPFRESLILADAGITANLTGGKTWNGFAPFIGIGGGMVFSSGLSLPEGVVDSSGYSFGRKFVFTPHAGTRLFLSEQLHLRFEAKATLWRLTYPPSFGFPPAADPFADPVITDNRPNAFRQGTRNAILQVGLGYAVKFL